MISSESWEKKNKFWFIFLLFHFSQVTRAQYQKGLLASKLDSTPQSPQSNHIQFDSMLAPSLTPPNSSMTCSAAAVALREETNTTTTLLNDRNSLNSQRAAQPQSYSNSNLNLNTSTNSSPHSRSNNHPQPQTCTPHLNIHNISHSHAQTESTIWQSAWGAMVGARLQRGPNLSTKICMCTWQFTNYMQCNTEALIWMNFEVGFVSSSGLSCMQSFFLQWPVISVKSRMDSSIAKHKRGLAGVV